MNVTGCSQLICTLQQGQEFWNEILKDSLVVSKSGEARSDLRDFHQAVPIAVVGDLSVCLAQFALIF